MTFHYRAVLHAPKSPAALAVMATLLVLRAFAQQQGGGYYAEPSQQRKDSEAQGEDAESDPSPCHPDWQWLCEDGLQCIAQYDVCDGIAQCVDHSDERNCGSRNRLPSHREDPAASHHKVPSHETPQPQHSTPKAAASTVSPPKQSDGLLEKAGRLRMEYSLGGLALLVLLAGLLIHWLMKALKSRRLSSRGGVRGFRKGESLVEDEDDLLISQMYT